MTSSGKAVENKDLVVKIRKIVDERTAKGAETVFEWIRGHDDNDGNVQADRLAVEGAIKGARERGR